MMIMMSKEKEEEEECVKQLLLQPCVLSDLTDGTNERANERKKERK